MNKQLEHEMECMERGTLKYYAKQDKLREKGLFDQTDASNYLLRKAIDNVADVLQGMSDQRTRGRAGKYRGILKRAAQTVNSSGEIIEDWHAVAFIGIQAVLQSQGPEGKNKLLQVANTIATRLEADLKFKLFEAAHPAYFNAVIKSFEEQAVTQYQHKHRVLTLAFNRFEMNWEDWCNITKFQIGIRVVHAVLEVLSDVFFTNLVYSRGKTHRVIDTSVAGDEWLAEVERNRGAISPLFEPCIEKPVDWEIGRDGNIKGGYHHPRMQSLLPFIKAFDKDHIQFIKDSNPQAHMDAINKMQATKWAINKEILFVQEQAFKSSLGIGLPSLKQTDVPEFPSHLNKPRELYADDDNAELTVWKGIAKAIHTRNKINKGKILGYKTIHELATRYKQYDGFHFVYNCDFRGRIYCATPGLSPQGDDVAKGLLRFRHGVRLGTSGINWLAIQAANVYGNDKIPYMERVRWLRDNEEAVRRAVSDPLRHREWWTNADKPWQFLAALFEWRDCDYGRNPNQLSYIPVGLDGSCNGIQHYSAMLRDEVGGRGVNLVNSEIPSDIYQDVADVLTTKLGRLSMVEAELWRRVGINRKLSKKPVMTLPYGSTQQSCRQYIYEYILDNKDKFNLPDEQLWELAKNLTPLMWEAIGEVVIAARGAMDWLQRCVSPIIKKTGDVIKWHTPIGFPVWQRYMDRELVRVETALCGGLSITVGTTPVSINKYRQRNGVAPNFVHSIDSTHMVNTINMTEGWDLAMIHDDFGTHAGRTQELYFKIRESFVALYENHDPLQEWYDQQPDLGIELPPKGNLDIRRVLTSTFFFG